MIGSMYNLTNRQKLLLKNKDLCECDIMMEDFIKDCENIAKNEQKMLKRDRDIDIKIIEYIKNYKIKCQDICNLLEIFIQ